MKKLLTLPFLLVSTIYATDVNRDFNFIKKKIQTIKEAESKFDTKREYFNNELYMQLELIETEKENNYKILEDIKLEAEKVELSKIELEKLKDDIILSIDNKMVNVYSKMRARKAAKILSKLYTMNKKDALNIIMRINERQLVSIFAAMKKDIAAKITKSIDNKKDFGNE
jgi:flagellar motility protein MotE (MotC chaperone)